MKRLPSLNPPYIRKKTNARIPFVQTMQCILFLCKRELEGVVETSVLYGQNLKSKIPWVGYSILS